MYDIIRRDARHAYIARAVVHLIVLFFFDSRGTRSTNTFRTFRWASNLQRAACFICKIREESQLCGGTLSFVIRAGDRLSAVVRFGSNMSYVRRASWRATGRLPRISRGRPRTIGGCINVKRSRRRKEKNKAIIISTTRQCLYESKGREKGYRAKGQKSNWVDCRGSMEEKERERNAIV